MPNVFSLLYHIGSISNFWVVGWYFSFYSNFKRSFFKQTVDNLIRRRILRRLILFCTVCRCHTKRTLGLYGLKTYCSNSMIIALTRIAASNIGAISYIMLLNGGSDVNVFCKYFPANAPFCLFVCLFDSLRPIDNRSVIKGRVFLG